MSNLFSEMSEKNISHDVVTCNAFIDGLCEEGKLDEVRKLFSEMVGRNICPVVFT